MRHYIFKRLRQASGFTLVELMVVLIVLVLIVLIAIPVMGNVIDRSSNSSYDSSIALVEKSAALAYSDGKLNDMGLEPSPYYTINELIDGGYLTLDLDDDGTITFGDNVIRGTDGAVQSGMGDGNSIEMVYEYKIASEIEDLIADGVLTEKE